ncbi:MAG: GvpL/GvpF family gas vesicle protein [Chloroflexi bacterium]|nr:GvpL/GvpF family gas vesicle protein [Chloroflexota bacterium]
MDDPSNNFQNFHQPISDEVIAEILRQAWAEAQIEARQLLKQKMVKIIMDQSAELNSSFPIQLTQEDKSYAPLATYQLTDRDISRTKETSVDRKEINSPSSSSSPDLLMIDPSEESKQLEDEIRKIRQKLNQNEQLLQQIKTPPSLPLQPNVQSTEETLDPADEGLGYYVYCVESTDSPAQKLPQEGIDPSYPLFTIANQSLRAVISQVSLQEFGEAALDINLHDNAWLESKVRSHQSILELLSVNGNTVPMRFCTIYLSESRVNEILTLYSDTFSKALSYLKGKQEWGVKTFCDKDFLIRHIDETDTSILALKEESAGKSSGLAYFTRKSISEKTLEFVERTIDAYSQDSHNRLSNFAAGSSLLQLQSKEATSREEEMVFNGAYLVEEEKISSFRAELEKLGNEYGPSGFFYDFTGPWPAYNFVNIGEIESGNE